MRKILVVVLLCAFGAFGQPSDIPLKETPLAPVEVCVPESDAIAMAKHITRIDAENVQLKKDATLPVWIPIVVGVLALGMGVSAGYVVAKAIK